MLLIGQTFEREAKLNAIQNLPPAIYFAKKISAKASSDIAIKRSELSSAACLKNKWLFALSKNFVPI